MMRAAQARGHGVHVCEQASLHWVKNRAAAAATRLSLTDNDEDWYRAHESQTKPLAEFGAVLMRKDPPFDLEYVASTWLLSAAGREGARGVAQPISARHRESAEAIGPVLAGRGLLLVGLDVIGDWLTEVNVTSPTCFREIQDQTGFDVSGMFLDALEGRIR